MAFRTAAILVLSCCALGCEPGGAGSGEREIAPADLVAAFFSEDLAQCSADGDCVTGRCDLTPTFTVAIERGYCGTFQTAFDRWQKVELAERLAQAAGGSAGVLEAVLARVDEELGYTRNPPQAGYAVRAPEKETLVVLLSAMASEETAGDETRGPAMSRLEQMYSVESGAVKRAAGLALAEVGNESAMDEVVQASFGASARLRLHAARAASGLCSTTSLGVLASLLEDPHPLVRAGAADALGRCRSEDARKVLEARRDALRRKPGVSGDLSAVEAALAR